MSPQQQDVWASGDAYEPYVGRWSRLVARDFIDWLEAGSSQRWLDVGCGTGALTQTVLQRAAPTSILGIDQSDGFIAYARRAVADPRAVFQVGDASALPVESAAFDAAIAGLVINFIPDTPKAAAEMVRAVRTGGIVAAYVWDYAGEMQMMRRFWDAAVALDPSALDKDEGKRFPLCRPEPLAALFGAAGLKDVETRAIDVPTVFQNFDDFWGPFLSGQAPAPGYCMSLSEERREALRERLRSMLPAERDGSIPLMARAWAVKGRAA
jgi:SAM-dependent methyltransferase